MRADMLARVTIALLLGSGESLRSLQQPRRLLINRFLQTGTLGAVATAAGLLAGEWKRVHSADLAGSEWQDPQTMQLRSATGAAARLERRRLESEWKVLREAQESSRIGHTATRAAFAEVLHVRREIDEADELVRTEAGNWANALQELVTAALVADLERAATVLASSSVLSKNARSSIGWQWGACGWRSCGAQADASQALCKLRVNVGMIAPLEALYYLDVAKRAVDEVLLLGACEGFVQRSELPHSEYLPAQVLEQLLATDEEDAGPDATYVISHKVLGTRLRAEKQFDLEERVLLEEEAAMQEVMQDDPEVIDN